MSAAGPMLQEYDPIEGPRVGAIWRYAEEHRKPLHYHGHLELLVVLRGKGVERIGARLHPIHAGHLVWLVPSIPHELLSASRDLDMRVVHAEPELVAHVHRARLAGSPPASRLARDDESRGASGDFSGWARDLGRLAAAQPAVEIGRAEMDRLLEDCDATSTEAAVRAELRPRLLRLLENAWRVSMSNAVDRGLQTLSDLATCVLLESPELDRGALCRLLGVSEGYLSRRYRKELGATFVEQRARVRVAHFVSGRAAGRRNLLRDALAAGFGSYSQLHRTFWDLVGMSPTDYLLRGGRLSRAWLTTADGRPQRSAPRPGPSPARLRPGAAGEQLPSRGDLVNGHCPPSARRATASRPRSPSRGTSARRIVTGATCTSRPSAPS